MAAEPTWPPAPAVEARMRELQQVLSSRDATHEQRDAARAELARLMMSPAAKSSPSMGEGRRPARAAIDPFPSVKGPSVPLTEPPPVAKLEVVEPSRQVIDPKTGAVVVAPFAPYPTDLRTGRVLIETPSGYVDPQTGRLIPR